MVPGFLDLVRMTGLEPVRAFTHKHLKLASLPIPAHPQISTNYYSFTDLICQLFFPRSPREKLFGFSQRKVLTDGSGCGNITLALNSTAPTESDARVVELVDSLASGASARKGVRVRLPPRAPRERHVSNVSFFFVFLIPCIKTVVPLTATLPFSHAKLFCFSLLTNRI